MDSGRVKKKFSKPSDTVEEVQKMVAKGTDQKVCCAANEEDPATRAWFGGAGTACEKRGGGQVEERKSACSWSMFCFRHGETCDGVDGCEIRFAA